MGIGFIENDIYETKREREAYIGKWVVISPKGMNSVGGFLTKYDEQGRAVLFPSQGIKYVKKDIKEIKEQFSILNREIRVPVIGERIEEVEKSDLENFCEKNNLKETK